MPPSYFDHPIVKSAPDGEPVLPLAIYFDGVSFTRTDQVLAFWVYNILTTSAHHCCIVLSKSEMCRCGCRKWCTLFQVWQLLRWSFESLGCGQKPVSRHDGTPFWDSDACRTGGGPLGFRGALILMKADWAELTQTLGFSNWQSVENPCLLCDATRGSMYDVVGLSPIGFPHQLVGAAQYHAKCLACEHPCRVPQAMLPELLGKLEYGRRKGTDAAAGRALVF